MIMKQLSYFDVKINSLNIVSLVRKTTLNVPIERMEETENQSEETHWIRGSKTKVYARAKGVITPSYSINISLIVLD
ncbi:hypothetical protein ACH0BF_08960 [Pseudobacillus sp. 179-B 2D1 NHS]|uniref:hypothetical protein n=1 Tax=Pseudobacillus sp. 179-B 2D1 NHS TaxID=3374292 RepID=UPI0038795D7A